MTPKIEKIWTCPDCHFVSPVKLSSKCERYGKDHDAILIPHYSQSSIVELLKERIEEIEKEYGNALGFDNGPSGMISAFEELLSMIEKGE